MKTRTLITLVVVGIATAIPAAAPADIAPPRVVLKPPAPPAPPPDAADAFKGTAASASASAAASAAPVASSAAPASGSFSDAPPGPESSKAPRPDEWKDAPAVKLDREVAACQAWRVREWVKVHCGGFPAAGASLLAGSQEGVSIWVEPTGEGNEAMKQNRAVDVIFPVRRGDGRVFQVAQFGPGWDGPIAWNLAYVIAEQWPAGEKAPIVTVR